MSSGFLGDVLLVVWGFILGFLAAVIRPRRRGPAVALRLTPTGDSTVETLIVGKAFPFRVDAVDANGKIVPAPAPIVVTVDGSTLSPAVDGSYSFTPTAASGEIDATCTGLPNLADPYTATDPAVALKLTPL
jgi:hypothetical protein